MSGAPVADDGIFPTRERGGHQASAKRQPSMSDRIYATVNAVQAADLRSIENLVLVEPDTEQLLGRDNAMLAVGGFCDERVAGAKVGHIPTKAPGLRIRPYGVKDSAAG